MDDRIARRLREGGLQRLRARPRGSARHLFWLAEGFTESKGLGPADGLTLQIYAQLLRAEAVRGFVIPARILRHIPKHLAQLFKRGIDYPNSSEEIRRAFVQNGKLRTESESIEFLWYPWGIQATCLWLERNRGSAGSDLETIQVRRALGHLVVDLGDEAFKHTENEEAFRTAEMLYALGKIPPL